MDKNGKVLLGYQNKECKAFFLQYLPLNNGAYGFEWVSDMQVICVVHLKPSQGGGGWRFLITVSPPLRRRPKAA